MKILNIQAFLQFLLISVHPVIGFWMLSILVISLIIYKDKKISLEFLKEVLLA